MIALVLSIRCAGMTLGALLRNQRGATAVEYGLILALVFLAIIGSVNLMATEVIGMWNHIRNMVVGAMQG